MGDEVVIEVIVGLSPRGKTFRLLRRTLTARPQSFLGAMFGGPAANALAPPAGAQLTFLDRDPAIFELAVVPFYEDGGDFPLEAPEGIKPAKYYSELDFWGIEPCLPESSSPSESSSGVSQASSSSPTMRRLDMVYDCMNQVNPGALQLVKEGTMRCLRFTLPTFGAYWLMASGKLVKWATAMVDEKPHGVPLASAEDLFNAARTHKAAWCGQLILAQASMVLDGAKLLQLPPRAAGDGSAGDAETPHPLPRTADGKVDWAHLTPEDALNAFTLADDVYRAGNLLQNCLEARHVLARRLMREHGLVTCCKIHIYPENPAPAAASQKVAELWPDPYQSARDLGLPSEAFASPLFRDLCPGIPRNSSTLAVEQRRRLQDMGFTADFGIFSISIDVERAPGSSY